MKLKYKGNPGPKYPSSFVELKNGKGILFALS